MPNILLECRFMFNRWELLYKIANILWPRICIDGAVYQKRLLFWEAYDTKPTSCPDLNTNNIEELVYMIKWAKDSWKNLYDVWSDRKKDYIFPNGYAVLFFLKILWGNETIILRGQYDSKWPLFPASYRVKNSPNYNKNKLIEKAHLFLKDIFSQPFFKNAYPTGVSEFHIKAILQHYGFPTDFLDFTYSYDVALYFAEGGTDDLTLFPNKVANGAIFAVPTFILPTNAILTTLPPDIIRPTLQRGVFLGNLTGNVIFEIEKNYKFVFKHMDYPLWNGLPNISIYDPIGIGQYLFPKHDPIETIAKKYR